MVFNAFFIRINSIQNAPEQRKKPHWQDAAFQVGDFL
jgi:hypothetical protein